MAITRWDPFRDVLALQNRMNSLFQDFNRTSGEGSDLMTTAAFVPPVDIYEDQHKIVLKLEVPGMKESDLDIQLENNLLTVKGERKFENEEKEENFHRIERRYGSFYRSFTIPNTVNPESVKANYDAGVLRVELEKRAEAKPKQIKVEVGGAANGHKIEAGKVETGKKEVKTA
ncbi:MAG TPA: Hsp20/alpha crystallin family protein [Acidobacteriaceae bacterium]|jgi:HSP20 family protein|nr:Hsp20/alpha crystallin family protein [Acidobacteriaceae bacterium]